MPTMPLWLAIVLPLAVMGLTVTVNAIVNIKVKFAPDAATANRELKALGGAVVQWVLKVVQWVLNLGMVWLLISDITSTEPLTRMAVFKIAVDVATLTLVVVSYFILRVLHLIKRVIEVQHEHVVATGEIQRRHLEVTERMSDVLRAKIEAPPDDKRPA